MSKSPAKLENLIAYKFDDASLLERAVTHRSWAYENISNGNEDEARLLQNETLEFVGDSVLGLVIAEQLYLRHPGLSEGDLTLMKHHLVSSETLGKIAKKLKLGDYMRVGKGEEKTGGRRKQALLADTLEAVFAAVFFDGGYNAARTVIENIFKAYLNEVTPTSSLDFKTLLQEKLQSEKRSAPVYKVVKTDGPSHDRTFWVEAAWEGGKASGKGTSIKSAEMEAANLALQQIEKESKKNQVRKSDVKHL
jgi:ribonuclease III